MKALVATPLRLAVILIAVVAVGAWCPQPLRGLLTVAVGLVAPALMIGWLVKRYLAVPTEVGMALGGIVTLAVWSLALLLLLAFGLKLSRPEVVIVAAVMLIAPAAVGRSWAPDITLHHEPSPVSEGADSS
jgi:hypothetical protein